MRARRRTIFYISCPSRPRRVPGAFITLFVVSVARRTSLYNFRPTRAATATVFNAYRDAGALIGDVRLQGGAMVDCALVSVT